MVALKSQVLENASTENVSTKQDILQFAPMENASTENASKSSQGRNRKHGEHKYML